MSERNARRMLTILEGLGIISIEHRKDEGGKRITNLYRLNQDYKPQDNLSGGEEENHRTTVSVGNVEPPDNQGQNHRTTVSSHKELKLFIEPKEEPKDTRARGGHPEITLPTWLDKTAWQAFVDHRREIKSKLTQRAMAMAVNRLDELRRQGSDPKAVIEQTILNGWTGLHPVRPQYAAADNKRRGGWNEEELLREGEEIGVYPKTGETWADFATRLEAAKQPVH